MSLPFDYPFAGCTKWIPAEVHRKSPVNHNCAAALPAFPVNVTYWVAIGQIAPALCSGEYGWGALTTKHSRNPQMKRPSTWLSVAVIVSALSPAALMASTIWMGDSWVGVVKSGDRVSFAIRHGKVWSFAKSPAVSLASGENRPVKPSPSVPPAHL